MTAGVADGEREAARAEPWEQSWRVQTLRRIQRQVCPGQKNGAAWLRLSDEARSGEIQTPPRAPWTGTGPAAGSLGGSEQGQRAGADAHPKGFRTAFVHQLAITR